MGETRTRSKGAVALSKWAEDRGTTQAELAAELGIAQNHFSNIVNGVRWPGRRLCGKIEEHTGGLIPVADWYANAEPEA